MGYFHPISVCQLNVIFLKNITPLFSFLTVVCLALVQSRDTICNICTVAAHIYVKMNHLTIKLLIVTVGSLAELGNPSEVDNSDFGLLMVMLRHVEARMKRLESYVEKSISGKSIFFCLKLFSLLPHRHDLYVHIFSNQKKVIFPNSKRNIY